MTTRHDEPWDDDSFKTIDLWITELTGEHAVVAKLEAPPIPQRPRCEAPPAMEANRVRPFSEQTTEDLTALAIALPRRIGAARIAILSSIIAALLSAALFFRG